MNRDQQLALLAGALYALCYGTAFFVGWSPLLGGGLDGRHRGPADPALAGDRGGEAAMRRTVLDRDALFWKTLKDGVELALVTEADDTEGWARICCTDHRTGEIVYGPEGEPQTVVVKGKITFQHGDGEPPVPRPARAPSRPESQQQLRALTLPFLGPPNTAAVRAAMAEQVRRLLEALA